jgi:hypothetical protein
MRYTLIIAGTALIVSTSVAGVLLSARIIIADTAAETGAAPSPVSIMKMMEKAKDLPVQQYDAI